MTFKVLVVDDQREAIRMMRSSFESLEQTFMVTDVLSGEEALLEARLQKFDLLVTDVRLPGITGLELMKKIRARNPDIKVILVTGITIPKVQRDVKNANADAYFYKPFDVADFLEAVVRVLGLAGESPAPSVEKDQPAQPVQEDEAIVFVAPDTLADFDEDGTSQQGVSEHLAKLRHHLSALSAVMLDDRGRVLVQAGDWPDDNFEANVISHIMATSSSTQKVAHFLGAGSPESLVVLSGERYDLVMSHVGKTHILLVIVPNALVPGNIEKINQAIGKAVADLLRVLVHIGVQLRADERTSQIPPFVMEDEAEEEGPIELDETLDNLFAQAPAQSVATDELDSFWDVEVGEESQHGLVNPEALSYEQALQLGLAPGDE